MLEAHIVWYTNDRVKHRESVFLKIIPYISVYIHEETLRRLTDENHLRWVLNSNPSLQSMNIHASNLPYEQRSNLLVTDHLD